MTRMSPGFSWDLSVAIDFLLQGILFAQITSYFTTSYHRDALVLRCFVCGLAVFTTVKSGMNLYCMYALSRTVFVEDNRNNNNVLVAQMKSYGDNPVLRYNVSIGALLVFYVQIYFCIRLYVISKKIYVVVVVATAMTAALVSAFVAGAIASADYHKHWHAFLTFHLACLASGDFLLTGTIVFFLLRESKDVHPRMSGILNALIRLTFQSAAPGAIFAIINLIFNIVSGRKHAPLTSGWKFGAIVVNQILPKLYAVSAMWTLNWRAQAKLWNDDDVDLSLSLPVSAMSAGGLGGYEAPRAKGDDADGYGVETSRASADTLRFATPGRKSLRMNGGLAGEE
ncbi:hypothetical protein R3P38DRAFT_3460156 [Favolaschia claudopus]|uniref:DUF6534 domain-containing protein n=1 Tax=Favolaschia claudopus TaxID=2862362 RepID=A0AAV9ZHS8_9AGAR